MPIIEATITEGREPEKIRSLIHELTYAAHRALDAPLASVRVIVREVPPTHFAAADETIVERRAAAQD
ncbi:MAG: 4-oxalocrotonate tautomerase [Actinomycetales bacterium]|nr:4-oxalocrotonate tautomerase [Actinomycetales bacterium]